MAKVIFEGFETIEQAQAFADWYSGQGEQESGVWLEECTDIRIANADRITANKQKEEITVKLKLYKK